MNFFLRDIQNKKEVITWDLLIEDIKNCITYNPYCKSISYYEIFKVLIISMVLEKEIILLDSDFTETELKQLTGYSEFEKFNESIDVNIISRFSNKSDLIEKLQNTGVKWKLTLFTSGTTGLPKRISHDYKSITRFVKINIDKSFDIWGFAYNPTHMAGIQVFFQSILNGNFIVRLFGLTPNEIFNEIRSNKISHISATPTFYKLLLPNDSKFETVKRITSGGEKFNHKTIDQLKNIFPNAKITNVYASSEVGALFASADDNFTVKPEYENLIRVEKEELLIHKSLLGKSDLQIGDWYYTGDLIEVLKVKPLSFRFVTRKSDLINIGGYNVNPFEIESCLINMQGIKDVRIFSKKNSVLGNILCCEIVCEDFEINELVILNYLRNKLQEFKIPRIIRFVDKIQLTRTGKITRV